MVDPLTLAAWQEMRGKHKDDLPGMFV
jgi:hypothetical protein